jgi:hypothetical protein
MGMNGPPWHPLGPNVFARGSIAFSWTSASGAEAETQHKAGRFYVVTEKKNRSFFPFVFTLLMQICYTKDKESTRKGPTVFNILI